MSSIVLFGFLVLLQEYFSPDVLPPLFKPIHSLTCFSMLYLFCRFFVFTVLGICSCHVVHGFSSSAGSSLDALVFKAEPSFLSPVAFRVHLSGHREACRRLFASSQLMNYSSNKVILCQWTKKIAVPSTAYAFTLFSLGFS